MFTANATVTVKNSKNEPIATQDYGKVVFEGTAKDEKGKITSDKSDEDLLGDAIAFLQSEDPKSNAVLELLKHLTYSYDLGKRASIRQGLVTAAAGPDKAIEKAIKDLMAARAAAGKPLTLEVAREKVMALMAD